MSLLSLIGVLLITASKILHDLKKEKLSVVSLVLGFILFVIPFRCSAGLWLGIVVMLAALVSAFLIKNIQNVMYSRIIFFLVLGLITIPAAYFIDRNSEGDRFKWCGNQLQEKRLTEECHK